MSFFSLFKTLNKLSKEEIEDILKYSKTENKKYLYDVISIKNITLFDISYIMNKLSLSSEKLNAINHALIQYEKRQELQEESYNDFLFRVVRNIENMEKNNMGLLNEIKKCKDNISNFNLFIEYLISKSAYFFENKEQGYVFSYIYTDKD